MFKIFFKFVGENKSCRSIKDFINAVSGKSYLNGMYRFFEKNDIDEWNDIVGDCFPKYKDTFSVLSYDWMGRIFALEKKTNMVILFEPGTGDVYDTDADIIKFMMNSFPKILLSVLCLTCLNIGIKQMTTNLWPIRIVLVIKCLCF